MKKLIILTTIILIVVNVLIGSIVTSYQLVNVCLNSLVILFNGIILCIIACAKLKDSFKISLTSLFVIIGIIEYCLGFFAPNVWSNNWFAIILILSIAIEIIIVLLTRYVTTKNK